MLLGTDSVQGTERERTTAWILSLITKLSGNALEAL